MDLTKSALLLTGSGGTMAAGAYATKDYWMPTKEKVQEVKSIRDSLKGRKLISSLVGEALTKQWEEEFESDSVAIKSLLKDTSLVKTTGGTALSNWCSEQMPLDADKNPEILKNVEKYCLIRSVSDQLSRKGKKLLGEGDGWNATYTKRKQRTTSRGDVGLSGEWTNAQESNDLQTIKTWCSTNSAADFTDSGTDSIYTKVLKWCTADGATTD
ncbi:hypothetical protein HF1_12010 [Mycoplasma haemofelis str. Langford 1]|uniref:Uncharacterized protein n=1 Tax=Mycoplasma haemofelis (strain Langford 1) TaxID=941640 RepID=E8ZJ88_MYCHL|nr:hypothetical protein [Mycoplasma haemofelis]CBY93209.1 hypothetical protein HF1_12010 [Mycoplasma haemofelis str. Langford 1]